MFSILSIICSIASLVFTVVILVEAFKDEIWKGLVSLLCGLYFLYYAFFDFDHEHKGLIICGWLGFSALSVLFATMAR